MTPPVSRHENGAPHLELAAAVRRRPKSAVFRGIWLMLRPIEAVSVMAARHPVASASARFGSF